MTENYQQLMQALQPAQIRRHARERMAQTRPSFWIVALVTLVLTRLVPDAVTGLCPTLTASGEISGPGLFLYILMNLFTWIISFGFVWWALDCADGLRGEDAPGVHTLFNGFSMVSGVLMLELSLLARMLLWCMLISVPLAFLILMTFFWYSSSSAAVLMTSLVTFGVYYFISLRYALARYLFLEQPEESRSTVRAIRDSVELMRGWKGRLFQMHLTFVGWYLLEAVLVVLAVVLVGLVNLVDLSVVWATVRTGGILSALGTIQAVPAVALAVALLPLPLSLWLTPYTAISGARFYRLRMEVAQCPPPVYEYGEDGWNGPEQ